MEIAVIGVDHRNAPTKIRERVAFTESKKEEAVELFKKQNITESVIVSTCNRSEIYICSSEIDEKVEFICKYLQLYSGREEIINYTVVKRGKDAVSHLYQVASGLKSLVIGEDQILGQVKDALKFAMEKNHSGKVLNKLFREAITKAKYIKSTYRISENPISVSYVGLKLLKEKIGALKGKRALIIGAGNIGKLSLKYILEEDLKAVYITNRTHQKLNELLNEFKGVIPVQYEERYNVLKEVDILISTTASPHTVFREEFMPKLQKDLYILDLAMPRDVDKKIEDMQKVHLYELDDLKEVIDENIQFRKDLSEPIKKIIEESVEEFFNWTLTLKLDPIIEELQCRCEQIKMESLDYIYRKTDMELKDKKIIEKMIHSALKKSINPIIRLKSIDDTKKLDNYIAVVNEIFRM